MKVFVFDLLAYGEHLDHLKVGSELPYPLSNRYFKADVAVRTYAEHLEAWEEMDKLGYDGVGFNEHHCSPYGLMNSPNLMAAAAAQRTKKLKLLIYGNLLPLHEYGAIAERNQRYAKTCAPSHRTLILVPDQSDTLSIYPEASAEDRSSA